MKRLAKTCVLLTLAALGWGSAPVAWGEDSSPSEYQLKAAFLFNFAKFAEWPSEAFTSPTAPMIIAVLGQNPFGSDLHQTIGKKTVNNRPVQVKEIQALSEATNCHVLFISTSEKQRLPEIFAALRGTSVLTVGETERFIETGGMVNFVTEAKKIRFQINDDTAKKARLKISSKLLSLGLPVR